MLSRSIAVRSPCPNCAWGFHPSMKSLKLSILAFPIFHSCRIIYRSQNPFTSLFPRPTRYQPGAVCFWPTGCPINLVGVPSLEQQLLSFTKHVCHSSRGTVVHWLHNFCNHCRPKVDQTWQSDAQLSCSIPLQISCTEVWRDHPWVFKAQKLGHVQKGTST